MIKYFVEWHGPNKFTVWEVSDYHKQWVQRHPKAKEIDIHEYLALSARCKTIKP